MGEVIELKKVNDHKDKPIDRWSISCVSCGSHSFKLVTYGVEPPVFDVDYEVECSNCGAVMEGLKGSATDESD